MKDVFTAKDTAAAIRKNLKPILVDAGFNDWTTKKAWRHREGRVDTIEFRSFNDYTASVLECTTASLSVWFGTWPAYVPLPFYDLPQGKKGIRPHEADMPLRGQIGPSIRHSLKSSDLIWLINDVESCQYAVEEISLKLQEQFLPWINRKRSAKGMLDYLNTENLGVPLVEQGPDGGYLRIDAGVRPCPARDRMRAHLYAATGELEYAAEIYERLYRWEVKQHRDIYDEELTNHQLWEFAKLCRKRDWPHTE